MRKEMNLLKKQMTKKAFLDLQKKARGVNGFNTGTRTHKDGKDARNKRRNWDAEFRAGAFA